MEKKLYENLGKDHKKRLADWNTKTIKKLYETTQALYETSQIDVKVKGG